MKIAILGTRGIPNEYGGFEQLAAHLSVGLVARGHEVYVYSSSNHNYKGSEWKGVRLLHRFDPEKLIGTTGQFIYDLNCIMDSRRRKFDAILNLGYTSSAIWLRLAPSATRIVTNMDGLEWKRSKYSRPVQRFLKYSEKVAVRLSDRLVADSEAIAEYLRETYDANSHFVAYGADIILSGDESVCGRYSVKPGGYDMLIARMEPENNIDMILEGANPSRPFLIIGNTLNKYGRYLKEKYRAASHLRFIGPEYDPATINSLRFFCRLYFHGHSVGGTNPSLLEAMGNGCVIAAHDNIFNRSVLGPDAYYFSSAEQVRRVSDMEIAGERALMRENNIQKIRDRYSWPLIVSKYEAVLQP